MILVYLVAVNGTQGTVLGRNLVIGEPHHCRHYLCAHPLLVRLFTYGHVHSQRCIVCTWTAVCSHLQAIHVVDRKCDHFC
jgi:hypothetical protein